MPVRTCVVCRTKRSKGALNRLVLDSQNRVVRDKRGSAQGRGVYVCSDLPCRHGLARGIHLGRAFRKEDAVTLHPGLWEE